MMILGLFVATALAVQAAPPQQVPAQSGTGVIQGRVLRAGTTEPIADAAVALNPFGSPVPGPRGAGPASPPGPAIPNRVVVTDPEGKFEFRDLPPGRHTAVAQRTGFAASSMEPQVASVSVIVANGQTAHADIFMTPTAVIRGRVRDVSGQFASNIPVEALTIRYSSGLPSLPTLVAAARRSTDDRGEYRLFGIPPGDYYIGATPRPLSATAAVTGGDRSAKTFHPAAVDVSRARKITIHGGEDFQNVDIAIQAQETFKITGTVGTTLAAVAPPSTAQGAFAVIAQNQNATIQMMLAPRDRTKPDVGGSRGVTVPVPSSGVGTFEIPNVMPGSYDLLALFNTNSALPAIARTVVDVRNENVSGLALTIRPAGAQIRGSITVDGNVPRPGTQIVFTPADVLGRLGMAMPARTEDDGSFMISGVPDGRFRLPFNAVSLAQDFYVDDVRQGGVSVFDSGFEARGADSDPIQVLIKSGSGSLDGTLQDASGRLLRDGVIALVPATRRENEALYHSSRSDSTGNFSIRGITPGDYKLFAWDSMPGSAHYNAAFLEKYEERGMPITIAVGAKLTPKVTAIPR
jgi:hypothetical protein